MNRRRSALDLLSTVLFVVGATAAVVAWPLTGEEGLRGSALYFHTLAAAPFVAGWVAFSWLSCPQSGPWRRRLFFIVGLGGLATTLFAALTLSSIFGTDRIHEFNRLHAAAGLVTVVALIGYLALRIRAHRSTPGS